MARFEELTCFVAVVEAGGISAAADRLGIAKSAVSRRLAALEQRLDVQLLNRTTRVVAATASGRAFYERAVRVLEDLAEAESAVAQIRGALSGTLRIALPLSFGIRHMSAPLSEFLKQHTEVDLQIDMNDRRIDLVADGMDLAMRIGRLPDSTLMARKLFDASMTVAASPNFIACYGRPGHPDALASLPTLAYSNVSEPDVWTFDTGQGDSHRVRLSSRVTAGNGDVLRQLAEQGVGIVMQPTFMLDDALRRGSLVPLLCDFTVPSIGAYAVYPQTRHLSFRVRALIDHLVDWFSGVPVWEQALSDCRDAC